MISEKEEVLQALEKLIDIYQSQIDIESKRLEDNWRKYFMPRYNFIGWKIDKIEKYLPIIRRSAMFSIFTKIHKDTSNVVDISELEDWLCLSLKSIITKKNPVLVECKYV